jgi:hypothetical protein
MDSNLRLVAWKMMGVDGVDGKSPDVLAGVNTSAGVTTKNTKS